MSDIRVLQTADDFYALTLTARPRSHAEASALFPRSHWRRSPVHIGADLPGANKRCCGGKRRLALVARMGARVACGSFCTLELGCGLQVGEFLAFQYGTLAPGETDAKAPPTPPGPQAAGGASIFRSSGEAAATKVLINPPPSASASRAPPPNEVCCACALFCAPCTHLSQHLRRAPQHTASACKRRESCSHKARGGPAAALPLRCCRRRNPPRPRRRPLWRPWRRCPSTTAALRRRRRRRSPSRRSCRRVRAAAASRLLVFSVSVGRLRPDADLL